MFKRNVDPGSDSLRVLRTIQSKYSEEYLTFFRTLSSLYKDRAPVQKRINEAILKTQKVVRGIGTLLGAQGRSAYDSEVKDVLNDMEQLDQTLLEFQQKALDTKAFDDRLTKVQKTSGLNLESLAKTQAIIKNNLSSLGPDKKSIMSKIKEDAPGLHDIGGGFMDLLKLSVLGPFAPLADMVGKSAYGLYKGHKERTKQRDMSKLESQIEAMADMVPPGILEKGPRKASFKKIGLENVFGMKAEPFVSSVGGARIAKDKSDGIEEFFNIGAYRSRWTKDVLSALGKKSPTSSGGMSFFGVPAWAAELGLGLIVSGAMFAENKMIQNAIAKKLPGEVRDSAAGKAGLQAINPVNPVLSASLTSSAIGLGEIASAFLTQQRGSDRETTLIKQTEGNQISGVNKVLIDLKDSFLKMVQAFEAKKSQPEGDTRIMNQGGLDAGDSLMDTLNSSPLFQES